MDNLPLVSVIIPVYNCKEYLSVSVESVMVQSYSNIEILLIDDGSSDGSSDICDELSLKDERIKVFHKDNGGVSSARNYGLNKANGEWISFLDGDDLYSPVYIESLVIGAKKNNVDIATCKRKNFKNEEEVKWQNNIDEIIDFKILDQKTAADCSMRIGYYAGTCTNKIFKSQLINSKNNFIRFRENLFYGEDTLFFYEALMKRDNILFVTKELYGYRDNPFGAVNSEWNYKWDSTIESYDRIIEVSKEYDKGSYMPHIRFQEACISLFLMRIRSNVEEDDRITKKIVSVVRNRWIFLVSCSDIPLSIRLASIPIAINPSIAKFIYRVYRVKGLFTK